MSISSSSSSYAVTSLLTTKGDILTHNGTTLARVAVGTNGQAITANSGQISGVSWSAAPSGGSNYYVPIAYTTITANTSTVSIENIPNSYKAIGIIAMAKNTVSGARDISIRFNSATTSYSYVVRNYGFVTQNSQGNSDSKILLEFGAGQGDGHRGYVHMLINQYADTSDNKHGLVVGGGGQSTVRAVIYYGHYYWSGTDAISSVQFCMDFSSADARIESGSKFYIYGLK